MKIKNLFEKIAPNLMLNQEFYQEFLFEINALVP